MDITSLNPSDSLIWPEYILPSLRHLVSDPSISVRMTFAQLLSPIAETAVQYLEMAQVMKKSAKEPGARTVDYELQGSEVSRVLRTRLRV